MRVTAVENGGMDLPIGVDIGAGRGNNQDLGYFF
jgi:hypothetical protein